jgi:hypothetical protein
MTDESVTTTTPMNIRERFILRGGEAVGPARNAPKTRLGDKNVEPSMIVELTQNKHNCKQVTPNDIGNSATHYPKGRDKKLTQTIQELHCHLCSLSIRRQVPFQQVASVLSTRQ